MSTTVSAMPALMDSLPKSTYAEKKKHKMGLSIYDLHIYVYMYMYLGLTRIYSRHMYITAIYMYLLFIYIGLTRALHVGDRLGDASFNRFVTKVHLRSRGERCIYVYVCAICYMDMDVYMYIYIYIYMYLYICIYLLYIRICYIYIGLTRALHVDHRFGDARLDGFVTEIHLRREKKTQDGTIYI